MKFILLLFLTGSVQAATIQDLADAVCMDGQADTNQPFVTIYHLNLQGAQFFNDVSMYGIGSESNRYVQPSGAVTIRPQLSGVTAGIAYGGPVIDAENSRPGEAYLIFSLASLNDPLPDKVEAITLFREAQKPGQTVDHTAKVECDLKFR